MFLHAILMWPVAARWPGRVCRLWGLGVEPLRAGARAPASPVSPSRARGLHGGSPVRGAHADNFTRNSQGQTQLREKEPN